MITGHKKLVLLSMALSFFLLSCSSRPGSTNNEVKKNQKVKSIETIVLHKIFFTKIIQLPGELLPYESVDVYPKIEGFIQSIYVDRASKVKPGQILANLVAPELEAQISEANANAKMSAAQEAEAGAKWQSQKGYYQRLKSAATIPGVIADNELAVAKMSEKASFENMKALHAAQFASQSKVSSLIKIRNYLYITAPIDGIVTERNLHPGALVGPSGAGANVPIFKIQDISKLRLTIALPERYYGAIKTGVKLPFTVSAYPGRIFYAIVRRPAFSVDVQDRSETIELDVDNNTGVLSPGMYVELKWTFRRPYQTFVIPTSALVTTTEKTFVIVDKNGHASWRGVTKGETNGSSVEIFGSINDGDNIVMNASDEIREGKKYNFNNIKDAFSPAK